MDTGVIVIIVIVVIVIVGAIFSKPSPAYTVKRGTDVEQLVINNPQGKFIHTRGKATFGGREVNLIRPFMFIGVPGSGKTLQLQMLLKELLQDFNGATDTRLVIREYKRGDFLPAVAASGITYKVIDPSAPGTLAWDIAKDCTSDAICDDIATTLIPRVEGEHKFFATAARTILGEVMKGLRAKMGTAWDFWDLFHIVTDEYLILEVSKFAPMRGKPIKAIVEKAASSGDSVATVIVELNSRFQSVAAAWKNAPKYSLQEFMKSREVLVIGHSHIAEEAMNAISATLTDRLIKYTLNLSNSNTRRIYFLLDELSNMAPVPGYQKLVRVGRSKGAFAISSIQDLASFQHNYGEKVAKSIIAMHSFLSVMECDFDTAHFISDVLGELEIERAVVSESSGSTSASSSNSNTTNQSTTTTTKQITRRRKLEPFELTTELPMTCDENGMTGYFLGYVKTRKLFWKVTIPFTVIKNSLPPRDPEAVQWCDSAHEYIMPSIEPFSEIDYHRLGVIPPVDILEQLTKQEREQKEVINNLKAKIEIERQQEPPEQAEIPAQRAKKTHNQKGFKIDS